MGRKKKARPEIEKFKKLKKKKLPAYIFKVGDEVIYMGNLYPEYHGLPGTVVEHSKTRKKEYSEVEFENGHVFMTISKALILKEEGEIK